MSDEIRAKRLARLARLEKENGDRNDTEERGEGSKEASAKALDEGKDETNEKLDEKLDEKSDESKASSKAKALDGALEALDGASDASKSSKPSKAKALEGLEDLNFCEAYVRDIMKSSLSPHPPLIHLGSLSEEIKHLNITHLESVFMEILTTIGIPPGFSHSLEYLHHVYEASYKEKRKLGAKSPMAEEKRAFLSQMIKFATAYGFICFQIPEMFVDNDIRKATEYFLGSSGAYFAEVVVAAAEQDSLLDLLNILLPSLSAQLYRASIGDRSYSRYLDTYEMLVGIKAVAGVFSKVDGFYPKNTENCLDYEHGTILGSILRLSVMDPGAATAFFGDARTKTPVELKNIGDSLRSEHKMLLNRLSRIVEQLIRGSAETRAGVLEWLSNLVNVSHLRRGSHAEPKDLASDGFMYNVTLILVRLSMPFLDYPSYSKIDRIDENHIFHSRIDIKEEARINCPVSEADEYATSLMQKDANFVSECFFLTLTYLHYGIGGIEVQYGRLTKELSQFDERIQMIENNEAPPGTNPRMLSIMRSQLPRLVQVSNQKRAIKNAVKAVFEDSAEQRDVFDFVAGACAFFTRLIDPSKKYPSQSIVLPLYQISKVSELDDGEFLRTKTPLPWKAYPEYFVESLVNYCKFSTNFRGCPLVNNAKAALYVEFSVVLLRCPELVGNPHLKSSLVEVLFLGSSPGFFLDILTTNKVVVDNVLYSLLDFYVMVEKTGSSSQFYDKFTARYHVSAIIETLWQHSVFRTQLGSYSRTNIDFFVRFIARMLNDTTYLLDESFNSLNSIHTYQVELKRRAGGEENKDLGSDEDLQKKIADAERTLKSMMQLCNKTMDLFKLFTKEVPSGFALVEIVDRLAAMLDYNLSVLVGPKCSSLKVEEPQKYGFDPRNTLASLCEIFANLSREERVITAVSRDGRSFDIKYFEKAKVILETKTYTDPRVISGLMELGNRAEEQRRREQEEELELGDVPDEFLDPLMFTLMEDPVILPGSRVTIDRGTIKAHLLSDPSDPFNRMPLRLEDVVEDEEMRERIESWKRQKIEHRAE